MAEAEKKNKGLPKGAQPEDVLTRPRLDRRVFSFVPDPTGQRRAGDRRGETGPDTGDYAGEQARRVAGLRYEAELPVEVKCYPPGEKPWRFSCKSIDVSGTGILLHVPGLDDVKVLRVSRRIQLRFAIAPGSMPEGNEMKVRIDARVVRAAPLADGSFEVGMVFAQPLSEYASERKDRNMSTVAITAFVFIVLLVALMRTESVIYFRFNKWLYGYSIVTAVFLLTRYLFGALYRPVPVDPDFTPGVTIIIPCFNEEEWIADTIIGCINQDYPTDKLEVILVDDCSTDRSVEVVRETMETLSRIGERYNVRERLRYVVQEQNLGKRDALVRGALLAKHELVVFVDSDSFLDCFAIRNLVQPFRDPKMGGVAGRTDVANTFTNALTKMQAVRYYISFRIMKAAESYFDAVTCLSGPLACYKKEIIMKYKDAWLNQRFLGQKATFGDDRAMTNFVLAHHRTGYQDTAICSTIVPNKQKQFLKQQMRWKRSWLRESMMAAKYMWRKEPYMALFFFVGLFVPIAAPIVFVYNMLYVPIAYGVFPTAFIVGILAMSLMMSCAQMLLRKSSTWTFGLLFCLYYEAVLLWQMPLAWVTFWKSTWGTRMTPADVEAEKRRAERERGRGEEADA